MAIYNPNKAVECLVDMKRRWDNAKATGKDTKPFEEGAVAYYKELRDNGRGDVADYLQKSDSVTAGEYLKTLTPDYKATAGDLQKKSNDVYDWTKDAGSQIAKDYDMVFQTIGVTPTRTDYGKDILGGYGIAAEGAYKGTLGGASGENGGNVDSYAAAQANRNKAAMVKEGYGTVLDYYNSIAGNATKWAGDKANALGGFAGLMQGNVTDDRDVVKTEYTTEAQRAAAERAAAAEEYAADRKKESDIIGSQLGYAAKTANADEEVGYGKWAKDMLGDLISRNTNETYVALPKDSSGAEFEYKSNGINTNKTAVAREIEDILNSNDLPFEQRKAMYVEALGSGYGSYLSADVKSRYGGSSGSVTSSDGSDYDAIKANVTSAGSEADQLDMLGSYLMYGLSDSDAEEIAKDLGIDITKADWYVA